MEVLGKDNLVEFMEVHGSAKLQLLSWLKEITNNSWSNIGDIKNKYVSVDILPNDKVLFHCIKGEFKLLAYVCCINGIVVIEKIGTIADYGKWNINR